MDQTLTLVALLVPCLVIAIVFHEVAHGYVAKLLGDPTASRQGRLTLNPIRHVDPVGTLLVPGALALAGGPVFGWAKPVPVNKWKLNNPRFGMMAVAAAGPLSNFLLALIGSILLGAAWVNGADFDPAQPGSPVLFSPQGEGLWLMSGLYFFILINLFLGLFNLLPIPPFDGSHLVGGLLPDKVRPYWEQLQRFGILLILGVVGYSWIFGTTWLIEVLGAPLMWAHDVCLSIATTVAGV
ncbi:MAG: site-2 protease family protein [Pseudomonadota bacterium]